MDGGGGTVPKVFTHNFCCYGNLYLSILVQSNSFISGSINSSALGVKDKPWGHFHLKEVGRDGREGA